MMKIGGNSDFRLQSCAPELRQAKVGPVLTSSFRPTLPDCFLLFVELQTEVILSDLRDYGTRYRTDQPGEALLSYQLVNPN